MKVCKKIPHPSSIMVLVRKRVFVNKGHQNEREDSRREALIAGGAVFVFILKTITSMAFDVYLFVIPAVVGGFSEIKIVTRM